MFLPLKRDTCRKLSRMENGFALNICAVNIITIISLIIIALILLLKFIIASLKYGMV